MVRYYNLWDNPCKKADRMSKKKNQEMNWGAKEAEESRIKIHDMRYTAVSLLIDRGVSVLAITERVGH